VRYALFAIFIFCIHVSMALFNAGGIFHESYMPHQEWMDNVDEDRLSDTEYVQGQITAEYTFGFGDFVKALWYFVTALGLGIVVVPYTLTQFGFALNLAVLISMPVYMIYFVALAEFVRGMEITPR